MDQEIAEKRIEAALAYQSNLLFQNVNQFVEKDQGFFLTDNIDQQQKKFPFSIFTTKQSSFVKKRNSRKLFIATKTKLRNFLTSILYNRLKQKGYDNQSFVIDSFSYILWHFNPINLEGKCFENKDKRFNKYVMGKMYSKRTS